MVRQVDDDPSAAARRARDGLEAGRRRGSGHRAAFSHDGIGDPTRPDGLRDKSRRTWPPASFRARRLSSRQARPGSLHPVADGTVIIIGGAGDKVRDRVILSRFVALAGGPDAMIAVISTAASPGVEAGEPYRAVFGDLGGKKERPLHAGTRPQANDETPVMAVPDATGVFLTGGNQLRLSSTIGGTLLADAILDRFQAGAVVAGTSAGASAMSSHMIAFGASGATPKHRM